MEDDIPIGFVRRVKWFIKFFFWSIGWIDAWNKAGEKLNLPEEDTKKIVSCDKKDTN